MGIYNGYQQIGVKCAGGKKNRGREWGGGRETEIFLSRDSIPHTTVSSHLPLSNSSEVMLHCMNPVKFHFGNSQTPRADMTNFMDFY